MPGHLNRFQLAFVRSLGVAFKIGEFGDVAVQISEAYGERIERGMNFGQQDTDVFGVVPGELLRHPQCSFVLSNLGNSCKPDISIPPKLSVPRKRNCDSTRESQRPLCRAW